MKNKHVLYVVLIILLVTIAITFLLRNKNLSNHISGGIVPHHIFADYIIVDFFKRLSVQDTKTIILIGPNHLERGGNNILTSGQNWETSFGILESDNYIINDLTENKIVKLDENVLSDDQSIANIVSYIKHYLPSTKIVPILLSEFTKEEELKNLSEFLKKYLNDKTVLVASVDFSHYLNSRQAKEKDKMTISLMNNFDYKKIESLDSSYLDSSSSINTLLMTMQSLGKNNSKILFHTNSGEIQKDDTIETTSYFSIIYY